MSGAITSSLSSPRISVNPKAISSSASPHPRAYSLKNIRNGSDNLQRIALRCNCAARPGGPGSGENESKNVLDAFFLGKALAEALSERIESTVGELLSTIGRVQAEQQKQVLEFQDEVLEKAKRAKEKAAREAVEAQGLIPKQSAAETSTNFNGSASVTTFSNPGPDAAEASPTPSDPSTESVDIGPGSTDPLPGVTNGED